VDPAVVEQLRAAARAFDNGNTGPLVALLDDDVYWRGVRRGLWGWKRAPE